MERRAVVRFENESRDGGEGREKLGVGVGS